LRRVKQMSIILYPWFLYKKYGKSECAIYAPLFRVTESFESEKTDVISMYRNRRCIRTVKDLMYLLQVFFYCGHIGTPV